MKKSEKREKMIAIFASKGFIGSYIREAIDESLALDDPKPEFIDEVKREMRSWYGFELTDEQVKEYLEDVEERTGVLLEWFDTTEREDFAYFITSKVTGMEWPMYGSSQEYKNTFYKTLEEQAPLYGYKWITNK